VRKNRGLWLSTSIPFTMTRGRNFVDKPKADPSYPLVRPPQVGGGGGSDSVGRLG